MVDAEERGSDEAQQQKGNRMKGAMTAERAATILADAKKYACRLHEDRRVLTR